MRNSRLTYSIASFLCLLSAVLGTSRARAQALATYQDTTFVGTYTPITQDSSLTGGITFDDNQFRIAIGFPFKYIGTVHGRINVSSNGFVKLGNTTISDNNAAGAYVANDDYTGNILNQNNGDNLILAVLNMDLAGRTAANGSSISIKRTGTEPNRSLVIQWKNLNRFPPDLEDYQDVDSLNFQLVLSEDGSIEYRYGKMIASGDTPGRLQMGLRGSARTQIISFAGTDLDIATRGTAVSGRVNFSDQSIPSLGRVYRFFPPPPAPFDAAAGGIVLNIDPRTIGCAYSTAEPVGVRVRNLGSSPMASATVGVNVNGVVRSSPITFNPAIAPREEQIVSFTSISGFDFSQFTTYRIKAYVSLTGDTIVANDTARQTITLRPPTPVAGIQPVTTFALLRTRGWWQGDGANGPTDSTRTPWAVNTDLPANIAQTVGAVNTTSWLYRPGVKTPGRTGIRFRLAVTDAFSTLAPESLFDDTLKVMVKTCTGPWTQVASFSQEDFSAGIIARTFNQFVFQFAPDSGVYSVAFVVKDNGTAATNNYNWHLDDIEFISTNNLQNDLAASNLTFSYNPRTGCLPTQQPASLLIRNTGVGPISQATVGLVIDGAASTPIQLNLAPPLAPGQNRTVSLTGASGITIGTFGRHTIKAFVSATGDSIATNDTIRLSLNLRQPIAIPGPTPVITYADSRIKGWQEAATGRFAPGDSVRDIWEAGTDMQSSTAYFVSGFGNAVEIPWIYRPGLNATGVVGLRFKAAVTGGFSAIATNASAVDDDTLSVVYSNDCGATWQALTHFTRADVSSGRISNTFKTFTLPLATTPGNYSVGFRVFKNGTFNDSVSYRWHLDNIEFVSSINVAADSVLAPFIPPSGLLGNCPGRILPISAKVTNAGVSDIDTVVLGYRYNNGPIRTQTFLRRLTSGQSGIFTFDAANLVAPNATGTIVLRIFTINALDAQATNDTLRLSFLITPAQSMPGVPFAGLSALNTAGYTQAVTRQETPASAVFAEGTSFGPTDRTAAYTVNAANQGNAGWLISPMYFYNVHASIYFNVAVTSGTLGTNAVASLGSDSLKVMYRLRCGAWQTLYTFTEADRASGGISNRLRPKGFDAPSAAPDSVQFAFMVARGATTGATYRWHINQVRVADEPLSARPTLRLPALSLFPVPASNHLEVAFGKTLSKATLRVTDLSGRTLMATPAEGATATLSVTALPTGLYLLTVETPDGQLSRPFTVQR